MVAQKGTHAMPQTAAKRTAAPPTPTKPRKSGWTPERRARQAARIRIWAPWAQSTGPRTLAGKKRSAQNAAKPALKRDPGRRMERALRDHGRYLTELNKYITLEKIPVKNELLKRTLYNMRRRLLRQGRKVTNGLHAALIYGKIITLCTTPEIDRKKSGDCLKRP